MTTAHRRLELAKFLKAARNRIKPREDIRAIRRRRAPGLLREEVAQAAGLSVTWYTWLEQGRPVRPSAQALEGVARALSMSPVERQHLFRLARPELDFSLAPPPKPHLQPLIDRIVLALAPNPAYAIDRSWNFLSWNDPAAELLGGFDPNSDVKSNLLARLFLDPAWRALFAQWERVARSALAQFRAATAGLGEEPEIAGRITMLQARSPEFSRFWDSMQVEEEPIWEKTIIHPRLGVRRCTFLTLRPSSQTGHTISVYFEA
jgi:transcriptional regulator with XRE-family HTH domain